MPGVRLFLKQEGKRGIIDLGEEYGWSTRTVDLKNVL